MFHEETGNYEDLTFDVSGNKIYLSFYPQHLYFDAGSCDYGGGPGTGAHLTLSIGETLSTNDVADTNNQLQVYPNPAKTVLNIKGIEAKSVQIYNTVGQLIPSKVENNQVNVQSLKTGTYILQVVDNNGITSQVKFIKE